MFGANTPCVKEGRVVTCQTLSGTGALRVGFEFIQAHFPTTIYVSNPSWGTQFFLTARKPPHNHQTGQFAIHRVPLLRREDQGLQLRGHGQGPETGHSRLSHPPPRLRAQPDRSGPDPGPMEGDRQSHEGEVLVPLLRLRLPGLRLRRLGTRRLLDQALPPGRVPDDRQLELRQKYGLVRRENRRFPRCLRFERRGGKSFELGQVRGFGVNFRLLIRY